jgi:hypothetical protein
LVENRTIQMQINVTHHHDPATASTHGQGNSNGMSGSSAGRNDRPICSHSTRELKYLPASLLNRGIHGRV